MATRSGSVDPGLLLHLLRAGTTVDDLEHVLEHESGLLGLSGVSADLRDVLRARADGDERAALAIDVFVHRIVTGVGAMVAALGGVDALVFTGGVGERSPEVRARVVAHLGFLGASVDDVRNAEDPADAAVSGPEATVAVLVVRAREELAIAHDALRLVHG
jgi:acetate kinase